MEFGTWVRFRHPLARSAAYWSASYTDRRAAHDALAEVTDPIADPDRRAWHRAQAMAGPDEEVAAELERSAGRAQARGGLAAAAAFLERSVLLTVDPARHAERALTAAQANMQAGAFGKAGELLAEAEDHGSGPLDELASARVELLRGQIAFASDPGSDAPGLLLKAARRLESLDASLAREAYLSAWMAALFAGRLAAGGDLLEVCRAARALPRPTEPPRTIDLVLEGLALIVTDGPAAAPALRAAVGAFAGADISAPEVLRWGWLAQAAASALWDDDAWRALLVRQVRLAREAGALDQLPVILDALGTAVAASGDFAAASALAVEADTICRATGARAARLSAMMLAALRGRQAEAAPLIEATSAEAGAYGQGIAVTYAHWAAAILRNGLGHYEDALTAAYLASEDTSALHVSMRALPELVEAAARTGQDGLACDALKHLAEITQPCGNDSALGIEARCRELIATGETVRKRSVETVTTLTAQEALIARLARDGRTNPEIGAQLFLSARTVEWHLRKIFTKLGISSRRELHAALAQAV